MKIVLISDTHNQHEKINLPDGDMLIHAGDVSNSGTLTEILNFLEWFSQLDFRHKIFIAGNHDFLLEKTNPSRIIPHGVVYLQDSLVEIEGLRIYGSPYTPKFFDWAFMKYRGEEMREVWGLIQENIDILLTHGPPFKILDKTEGGEHSGCEELLFRVAEIKPRIHAFGHIHEAYGTTEIRERGFLIRPF
jgi:Icc-related predicted phosphoesterase